MRPWLRWVLAATVVVSGLALVWPDKTVHAVSGTVLRGRNEAAVAQAAATTPYDPTQPAGPLPALLPRHVLGKANFDPFVGVQPPAPPATPAPKPFVGPVYQPPPPPPPINYRYLGQMTTPGGDRLVYLNSGTADIPVAVGTRLDEGYVVESIASDGVHLYYPPLKAHAIVPMSPPAQDTSQFAQTTP
jgi:hypothetical protein